MADHTLTDADLDEAKDLDRRFADAWARKDLDAAMACFWDDPGLHLVLDGEVHRGPGGVRAVIRQMMEQADSISLTVDEITYIPSGEAVAVVGTATYDIKPLDGPGVLLVERWSDLRRKVDGRWVFVLDHVTFLPQQDKASDPAQ